MESPRSRRVMAFIFFVCKKTFRGNYMVQSTKTILLTAASVSLALTHAANATDRRDPKPDNPYVAGDMHNHNTCTDGSVSAGYAIDRSVATGVAAAGGRNF